MDTLLPDVCRIQYGFPFDSEKFSTSEGIPLIRIRDVVRGYSETYTSEQYDEEYIVDNGDLLIGMDGEFNIAKWKGGKALLNQRVCRLFPKRNIDKNYLLYFMSQALKKIEERTPFATVKHLSAKQLNSIIIPILSLDEQRHLGAVLDTVSKLITLRKQQLAKLDKLVKARFVEMFGEPETNTKGWPVSNMGNLCSVGSSKRIYQSEQSSAGIPFWRVSDLTNLINTGVATENLYIPEKRYTELQTQGQVPVEGDILVTSRGTLGQCYIVKPTDRFYFQDGMISWLSEYADGITPLYISHLFSMPGFRKQIDSMQVGSTVAYLSIAMIKKLMVMIPNVETQQQFAAFVEQTDKCRLTIRQGLDKLEIMKKALMQQYFG